MPTPCWNCMQPATHTLAREGSNTLHACDNCTRIDRAEATERSWTIEPIAKGDATPTHFTAWMANDPSVVSGDFMDVTVIEDEIINYKTEIVSETFDFTTGQMETETAEVPEWASRGPQVFFAETGVNAREGDAEDGIREAEALMEAAGWKVVGDWEAVDNAYVTTVERIED